MTLFRKNKSKGELQQEFQTTVRFLDDSEPIQLPFTKDTLGQYVLDKVCETLNLVEKDYFGLRYVDAEKQRHWLDPTKTVYKQLKGVSPCVLCFRVKFYPEDPMKLHEEITRYYLFLQLRRDLHHGRLLCSPQDANLLAAFIIQSEVGDYDPQDHPPGYVAEFKMLPNQNVQQEQQIQDLHKTLTGQVPAEAEANFLKKAATLDTYGVDPHKVKDQKGNQMYLGVTHQGIMTFHGSRRTQLYKWSQVKKLAFEGKTFIAHVNVNEKHQPIGYKCLTVSACKYLWRCAVEQQFFFTLQNSFHTPKVRSGGSLFSRGSKFRFSGRCQNEAYMASEEIKRKEPEFQRTCSLPNFVRKSDSMHMKNSANISDSLNEDRGGRRYKEKRRNWKAETLPRITTTTPSVSVEPQNQSDNRRGGSGKSRDRSNSRDRERKDSDSRERRRLSREMRESKTSTSEGKDTRRLSGEKPKLKEVARETSKEVYKYTETAERRTVLEDVKTEVVNARPVEVVTHLVEEPVRLAHRSENAVDVEGVSLPSSPTVKAPVDAAITEEQVLPVRAGNTETAKQNGGIPIIVTSTADTMVSAPAPVYNPEDSIYDNEEDEKVAKSLEEQVMELEKEFEQMQESNHTGAVVSENTEAKKTTNLESRPNNVKQEVPTAQKKGGCSCGKVFAFTLFSVFVTLTVSVCVVMFSELQHPVMNDLRSHLTFLEPARDFIQDKYDQVFHS